MIEQLELFDSVFDWKYVFQQINGREAGTHDCLGVSEVNKWGMHMCLNKFSLRYKDVITTRTMKPSGHYDRKVEYQYD